MKKLATVLVAAGALIALSGCVADPYYGNSYYGGGYYNGSAYGYYGSSRPYYGRYDRPYRGRYYDRRYYRRY
jgi:hypothetical protein